MNKTDIKQAMQDQISKLTAEEGKVLRLLYGIDCVRLPRAEISRMFDKNIDGIEVSALRKLRQPIACG